MTRDVMLLAKKAGKGGIIGPDDRLRELVGDPRKGYLTRRGFLAKTAALGLTAATGASLLGAPRTRTTAAQDSTPEVELEHHNQEDLAADEVYKFAYILGVNKIQGAAAGTVLRPIGIV